MRISFLVPAYNEAATIGQVLDRIADLALDSQIVVVDDGSTDRTAEVVEEASPTERRDRPHQAAVLLRVRLNGRRSRVPAP